MTETDPRALVAELCRHFYFQGWATGTGGGISIKQGDRIYMAPSGVQKERIRPEDVFVVDLDGAVLEPPADASLKLTACAPLFMAAFRQRDAGAVLHGHSQHAALATLLWPERFRITHIEMIKGLRGYGYHDTVEVPVIPNTAHECDLADSLAEAIDANPQTDAVLVQRHGVYVWGRDWQHAKTQAECYDYLFELAARMKACGIDPAVAPEGARR
ncbi:MAG: methylthioribulose 1-phosphate dehydratase [Myxococcales bacterium]|nr:methylthioribulose 1-phosphate dehydratase [Myxococcales bacterium]MCB9539517.1 methylthioribulose 1-phosphate dehydratase [Myxococcales bacterium]